MHYFVILTKEEEKSQGMKLLNIVVIFLFLVEVNYVVGRQGSGIFTR